MKRLLALVAVSVLAGTGAAGVSRAQGTVVQYMASETYYTLEVASGSIRARVEAEVQPAGPDLAAVTFWAMPGARDIRVTRDGKELPIEVDAAIADLPAYVVATLDQPLKGKLTTKLQMTYSVPPGKSLLTDLQAGAIETMLVSQGAGSFLLVDVPETAENVLDPGCVPASRQPGDVRDAGYQRWVCGEVLGAAFGGENDKVRQRCASLDDTCRQRSLEEPFSAFVQSTTDESLLSNLDADIALSGGPVPLSLRYFRSDRAWAEVQFGIAQQSLPRLEALFGFPYPHDQIVLRQSTYIALGGAGGIAFTSTGEMLLASGIGPEVESHITVHELAHQWAGLNLAEPWIWEGLAEYARRTVGNDMGLSPWLREWKSLGYTDPLSTMYNGSPVFDPDYWYGRAGDFWFAYEQAIGGREAMTKVLSGIGAAEPGTPLDDKWFMDAGERVSGANLDQLFLDWVWQPDRARASLAERRAAHNLVDALETEAAALGLTGIPVDIRANLDQWTFGPVAKQVAAARETLKAYRALVDAETAAGLAHTAAVSDSWGNASVASTDGVVRKHAATVELLVGTAGQLAGLDAAHESHGTLAAARAAYDDGELDRANQLAAEAVAAVYNIEASERMIAIALAEQAAYQENFFKKIGLLWSNPDADLAAAQDAYEAGDHADALQLSRSAYEAWNGASARGLKRLALLAGTMAALSVLVWWVLMRMDRSARSDRNMGHRLERDEPGQREPGWRDWENTP